MCELAYVLERDPLRISVRRDACNTRRSLKRWQHCVRDVAAGEPKPEAAVRLPDERVAARTEREGENDFVLSEAVSVAAVREERRDRRRRRGEERDRPGTGPLGEADIGCEGQYHERRREDAERDDARRSGEPQRHDHCRDERREERKANGHQVYGPRTRGEVEPGPRVHAAPCGG